MLKNITFSASEDLIRKARERAAAEKTTLNEEFRKWLEKYAGQVGTSQAFHALMDSFGYVQPGRSFNRDEMNER
jgi:hypothetical protein